MSAQVPATSTDPPAEPRPPSFAGPWHLLFWLTARQRGRALRGALFGSVWMVGLTVPPYALRMAVDHGLEPGRARSLALWTAVLVVVAGASAWLSIMRHRAMTWVRMDAAFRTIRLVSDHAMRLGHASRRANQAGEIAAIGLTDAWTIGRSLTATGPGVGAAVTYAIVAVLLSSVSPLLAVVILVGVPVLALVVGPALSRLTRVHLPYRQQQAALTDQTLDIAGGLHVLSAIGGRSLLRDRFARDSARLRDLGYRIGGVASVIEAMTVALPTLFLASVVWLSARMAAADTITIGELVAVYGYAAVLVVPVTQFIEGATDFGHALVPARRVVAFLAARPAGTAAPDLPAPPGPATLADTVTGVRVEPGTFTAVVTGRQAHARGIVDRLAGLEPGGLWGEAPVTRMPPEEVRSRLLVADDDAALFAGPLLANVAGSGANADPDGPTAAADDRCRAAVTVAAADDVVASLPGEWQGALTPGGSNLSGGQRQRVRLARAVAAEPEILLAVDPTSALDAHTEAAVARRLRKARSGLTTLVTTHSPLVLEGADHVQLVIDGRTVAAGTHAQLLDDPRYVAIVVRGETGPAS